MQGRDLQERIVAGLRMEITYKGTQLSEIYLPIDKNLNSTNIKAL